MFALRSLDIFVMTKYGWTVWKRKNMVFSFVEIGHLDIYNISWNTSHAKY